MKDKIILHVDANSFYASVETSFHPELKTKPVAVSGNPKKRNGIILAKNELAKKQGVLTGEAIWQAKQKCPDLICLPPNMELYEDFSSEMHAIFEKYTHKIEPMGLDECWLDITDTAHLFGGAEKIAADIRKEIREKLKITVSVGISFSKILAKLGSDLKKPDAQTTISRENYKQIVYPLPIDSIIGIGSRMTKNLNKMNVFTLGDLLEVPAYILDSKFSIVFKDLRKKLLGFSTGEIASIYDKEPPKSVGNGTTTICDIFTKDEIRATVLFLADKISARLRKKRLFANSLSISIRDCKLNVTKTCRTIPFATNTTRDLVKFAMDIINEFWGFDENIRSIRLSARNLTTTDDIQCSIFECKEDIKKEGLNTSLDELRKKYGKQIILPAKMLSTKFISE